MEGLAANSCCLLSSPAPFQGSPRPPRGLQFSGPEMQAGGGEEEQPETEGVSVCLAETTQGCGGRPGVSQAGHPADVQTWVSDPRATPPATAWSWKRQRQTLPGSPHWWGGGGHGKGPSDCTQSGIFQVLFWNNKTFSRDDFFFLSSKLRCNLHFVKSTLKACSPAS